MCSASKPSAPTPAKIPEPPPPPPPPEETAKAPEVEGSGADSKDRKAKKTGTNVLRNDLTIPQSTTGGALNIPRG